MYNLNIMSELIYLIIASLILLLSFIIFDLFWVMFRYNLLYVTVFRSNTRGLLYSTILNQLFTSVYVLKLCMIGLFFLVRDNHNRAICVDQAVIMIIATTMTLVFQLILNDVVASLLRFMPQTEMRKKKKESKYRETRTSNHLRSLLRKCFNWLDRTRESSSINEIFFNMHSEMKNFTSNERDDLASLTFQHESLRIQRPVIWIPDDRFEISDDEISRIKQRYDNVRITNEHADLDEKRRVIITQIVSDFSEVKSMKL